VAHPVEDAVVVVTGASSGIGRATVELLAQGGATVAAVARRREPLEALAAAHPGDDDGRGRVLAMPADVTDAEAVERIAAQVVGTTGKLDAWVNNAAVNQYGRFEELPLDEWKRVVDVNLFGYVHGARAAIPWFREQGEGVLVNVASVLAKVPAPMQSAYVASKYAIRGLTESLRQELRDADGLDVCLVMPGPIDTPLFQHAANRTGVTVKPPEPTIDAARVAAAIVKVIASPEREVAIGASTRLGLAGNRLAPGLTEKLGAPLMEASHFVDDEHVAPHAGNLFEPMAFGTDVSGGWKPARAGNPGRTAALVGGAAGAALAAGIAIATSRERDGG
jgi:NAD(P)-dependent dehydrogenase (short-subunit alcohol dehydrogenase family)